MLLFVSDFLTPHTYGVRGSQRAGDMSELVELWFDNTGNDQDDDPVSAIEQSSDEIVKTNHVEEMNGEVGVGGGDPGYGETEYSDDIEGTTQGHPDDGIDIINEPDLNAGKQPYMEDVD